MRNFLRSWWPRAMSRRGYSVAPRLERLENRIVFALSATPLPFTAFGTAHVAADLTAPNAFDLYQVHLNAGDVVNIAVSSQIGGGALQSNLRVFDATGRALALDAQQGGDARLTFQAPRVGDYLVGVSSAGDDAYDPAVATSGQGGVTTGLYALDLQREPAGTLTPELEGSSFRLQADTAAYGDTISGTFTVDNRGGAAAGPFTVQVVLSADNRFGPSSLVLTTFSVPGLGAGQEFTPGNFTVRLPDSADATAAGLPVSGPVYLGLRIDPAGAVRELNPHDQSGVHRGEDWGKLTVVTFMTYSGNNHSPASAEVLLDPNSRVRGVLTAGQTDWYQITVPTTGRLAAVVTAGGGSALVPRLTLAGPNGQVLIQSDDAITQYLPPGTYLLAVSAPSGTGTYELTSDWVPGSAPFSPVAVGGVWQGVVADLNNDGTPDIVTFPPSDGNHLGTIRVLLCNGDGTFQPALNYPVGVDPGAVAVADVNGDGSPDIIVANAGDSTVSVLLGNGDGTFQPQKTFPVGSSPYSVAVADLNGDGKPDIVTADVSRARSGGILANGSVSVLLGNGDGTFQTAKTFPVGPLPYSVAVADLNGDGKPDIVTTDYLLALPGGILSNGGMSVLLGNGDGTFQTAKTFPVGPRPYSVAVADLNGDGKPDIIMANRNLQPSFVNVLLGNGDGSFGPPQTFAVGYDTRWAVVADVNGDGKPDVVAWGLEGVTVSMLLGNGDGTFQPKETFPVNLSLRWVGVADFNGDGKPDIVAAGPGSSFAQVLLGNGDGTFLFEASSPVGLGPHAVAADVNGDGKPDIVSAGYGGISVLLGNGDGTFQPPRTFPVGKYAYSVAVADLNGDGKPDIVSAGYGGISVLLGNGDGTFQPPRTFPVGKYAFSVVVVADLNGDGKPDIATANPRDGTVHVLLGKGDGTFQPQNTFPGSKYASSVVVADVNGDGKPDVVTEDGRDGTVSVLLGNGDGTFQPQKTFPLGLPLYSLAVADLNGDGKPDIVVISFRQNTADVLLGKGDGTFQPPLSFPTDHYAKVFSVADVNGDGKPDIIMANFYSPGSMSVFLGKGDGTFQPPRTFPVSPYPYSVVVRDVNGDGRPDIAVATLYGTVDVLLGNGDGSFTPLAPGSGVGLRNTPYLADLTGDRLPDSVVLNRAGDILFRKGLPGTDNPFAPPVVLNRGRPARDLTLLHTATGLALATADESFDPTLSGPSHFVFTVSVYTVAPDGPVHRTTAFSTTRLPTRIAAVDLTGNGLDDLIVADSLDNSIEVAFQQPDGSFSAPLTLPTGQAPSDISVADFNGGGLPDIAVSNQGSGDVSVFLNDPQHSFVQSYSFRAGTGLYGLDTTATTPTPSSLEQSVSLASGDFTGSGRNDLLVVNRGSDSFSILANDGQGGFANPQPVLTTSTSDGTEINTQAGPTVAGHFHGPKKPLDVAILMKDRAEVWIFTGNGDGTFTHTFTISVGAQPTGLNLFHNPQTGFDDLLVGDPFGDVLHLQGKGDGTFQIAGRRTTLAVQQLSNGQTDVLVANEQSDRVTIQTSQPGSSKLTPIVILADGTQSTLAPGAVQWAKLDKNSPYYDAIVVASGGNEVLVYRGTGFDPASGAPTFAPAVSYAVGTNPVSVTIQDLNGDSIPDLIVTNQGSDDVSLIFGSWDGSGNWAGTAGPRLKSGGSGPIATQAVFPAGGGLPQLVITNGQSGSLAVLPGVGQGFFNDQNPQIVNLPGNPVLTQGPTFFGSSGSGVLLTATGQLLGFNLDDLAGSIGVLFAPAGDEVAAAQALADGHVVAVLDSGTVVDLAPAEGGLAVDSTFVPLTGIPSEPSALAVLQEESGMQVLVTAAGGDRVFAFGILEPLGAPVLPEPSVGPVVEVTPLAGEPLTVVVTLTAGTGPAGGVTAPASPATTLSTGVAAESLELSEADVLVPGLVTLGAVSPAWALGLLTRLPGSAPVEDAAGEVAVEQGPKPVAAAEKPRPAVDGLDLDKLLRELDLYQPTPSPERPGPTSGRLEEQRGPERMALTPSADVETLLVDLAVSMAADLEASSPPAEVSDAVLVQTPSSWSEERWRLLGLAGLALWPWPSRGFQSDGEAQRKPERPRGRPVNLCFRV